MPLRSVSSALHRVLVIVALGMLGACEPAETSQAQETWVEAPPEARAPVLGSTENSVVAIPPSEMPDELVYVSSRLTPDQVDALRSVAPRVRVIRVSDADEAARYADEAHGMDAQLVTPGMLRGAGPLRWMQSWSAGVERYVRMEPLRDRDDVVLTNMAGMYGPVIAEHVFGMLLAHTRNLSHYLEADREGVWSPADRSTMSALQGRTMLVVGLGGIGSEIAVRAHAFGMRVLGTVRTARPAPAYVDYLGTGDELAALLPQADIVVLAVPLTDETRGMIDATALSAMPEGAWIVNIARGPVVDTDALVDALRDGHVGAAFLDVTDPEPLPEGHPLWTLENVYITPHTAGGAELSGERAMALFTENLRRFSMGEPLLNVVDKSAGY